EHPNAAGSSGTPCATNGTPTLNAGSNGTIDLTFDPSAGGNQNATVNATASPGGNASTSLTGTGTIAKLTISPGNHNFGNAAAGTPVGPFTFTVTNSGTETSAAVTFTVNGSSEFSAVTGATPPGSGCISGATTLAPGASCTIDVTWNSTAPTGDKKARLDVSAGTGEGTPHADLSGKTI